MDTRRPELETDIVLALGPTNTGKTHRAVTRMLEHTRGMIGLPLRLLAREVYDRVTRAVGEADVALVTGEEKRVPRAPRYWVCTVEAMPLDVPVDFLAVDEIQLAVHRERGHVFTERLLSARGARETWFLGADTMAPILRALLPRARLERQARLSSLRHAGRTGLSGLPPRSAVVTFTANEVYELAARMRAKKGGVAVVLGALSPRTRNAQVALYEAREVQYLVATDAIGMGLNLDVDHVAFASLEKFDGREHRPLEAAELGQIAGRAGRHMRDGTFGTLSPLPVLPDRLVEQLEAHRFPAVKRLVWRNADLDFASIEALIGALSAPVPGPLFTRIEQADDFDALRLLAERESIRARATSPRDVRLLWDVCQVPDYRKLTLRDHAALLETLYVMLVDTGRLDRAWVEAQVRRIDRVDGEIDELTARLAAIRVWTYVVHQRDWIEGGLEGHLREIEDRLGDALHGRLVERFVERTTMRARAPAQSRERAGTGALSAKIGGLLAEAQRAEARARAGWVEALVAAHHEAFEVGDDGTITYSGELVGRLVPGRELFTPGAAALDALPVDAGAKTRIDRRLAAFARDLVPTLLGELASRDADGFLRGVLFRLERGLGVIDRSRTRGELDAVDEATCSALEARGVVVGERVIFARRLLGAAPMRTRAVLVRIFHGPRVVVPPRGAVSARRAGDVPYEAYLALGYLPIASSVVRVDVVERVLDRLRALDAPFTIPDDVRAALGVRRAELPRVLAGLGVRAEGDGYAFSAARSASADRSRRS